MKIPANPADFHPQAGGLAALSGSRDGAMLATSRRPSTHEDGWSTQPRHHPTTSGTPSPGACGTPSRSPPYDSWFGQARPRSLRDGQLVVEVPNDFTRDWIEGHPSMSLRCVAQTTVDAGTPVSFAVAERPPAAHRSERPAEPAPPQRSAGAGTAQRETVEVAAQSEVHLRPLRHRLVEPLRARRGARGRRGAGPGVQPAVHLRRTPVSARRTCCRRSATTSGSTRGA